LYTWACTDGKSHNHTDYKLIDRRWNSSILDVQTFRGLESDDFCVVVTKVRERLAVGKQEVQMFNVREIYRIFQPITCALSIQKGSKIVKNEHARYTLERLPTDNARVICTKKRYRKIRYYVLNITFN